MGDVDRQRIDPREFHGLGRIHNEDGIFTAWAPARWAKRMGANKVRKKCIREIFQIS